MKKSILLIMMLFSLLSCDNTAQKMQNQNVKTLGSEKKQSLTIVCWNVQTFFDAVDDGVEYQEFRSAKSKWNKDAYEKRLDRLCSVIKTLNADVYVFEEIENSAVLYDISNKLADTAWSKKDAWNYACFAKNQGSAIGLALLSRFALSEITTHNVDIQTEQKQSILRPIMSVCITKNEKPLTVLVNHWKSKSGGEETSEVWRAWQEHVLSNLVAEKKDVPVVACGDFNKDIHEFKKSKNNCNILLRSFTKGAQEMRSAWFSENGTLLPSYSYYYNGMGERIDHFFWNENVSVESFASETSGAWANENGEPERYAVYSGNGYSDHLPLSATFVY
ncbi:MAG: endonuclease/exonuclease/phosphatase family protein [Treponema sp.]|nr:endonuclease/exonuclease/phosphatase family protein [Treponema sp.]